MEGVEQVMIDAWQLMWCSVTRYASQMFEITDEVIKL
jgi:hypothetical protein